MKLYSVMRRYIILLVVFVFTSCNEPSCCGCKRLNYEIENKLSSPINVRFEGKQYNSNPIDVTILSNRTESVIGGVTGSAQDYGLSSYDSAFVAVNEHTYSFSRKDSRGLLSSYSYKEAGSSLIWGEECVMYKLTIDEAFLLNSVE